MRFGADLREVFFMACNFTPESLVRLAADCADDSEALIPVLMLLDEEDRGPSASSAQSAAQRPTYPWLLLSKVPMAVRIPDSHHPPSSSVLLADQDKIVRA